MGEQAYRAMRRNDYATCQDFLRVFDEEMRGLSRRVGRSAQGLRDLDMKALVVGRLFDLQCQHRSAKVVAVNCMSWD